MLKSVTALLSVVVLVAGLGPAPQERVKPKGPADFHRLVDGAKADWDAGRYGPCVDKLQTAIGLATDRRGDSLLDAFPAAPAGWEIVPDETDDAMRNNPFAKAMAASMGSVNTREYRETGGQGHIRATLTADSPIVGMFNMWITNPAMLEPGSELIKYDEHNAVLKSRGGTLNLQILINGKHICEVAATGTDEDTLFAVFDQKAVDTLAGALGK